MTNKELAAQCLIEAAEILKEDNSNSKIEITELECMDGKRKGYKIKINGNICKIYNTEGKFIAETDDIDKCDKIIDKYIEDIKNK